MATYYGRQYFSSSLRHSEKRDLDGKSVSDVRGSDGKKNNTSEYNHDYYMRNKEKWKDNNSKSNDKVSEDSESNEQTEKEFDIDAAALDVIRGKYGNGQARKDALGDDYEMVQKRVNEMYKEGRFGSSSGTSNKKEETETKKKSNKDFEKQQETGKKVEAERIAQYKSVRKQQETGKKVEAERIAQYKSVRR